MARLDGKQIQIGFPTSGAYGTNSQTYGITSSMNLPDALDALANNMSVTVTDYNTGATFTNIQQIVFVGGKVVVPQNYVFDGSSTQSWTASEVTSPAPNVAYVYIPGKPGPNIPLVTTDAVYNVLINTAQADGTVVDDDGSPVTQRGFCWAISPTVPTTSNSTVLVGTGTGSFSGTMSGLAANTTYKVRAFATNASGTGYGSVITFTTLPNFQQKSGFTDITDSSPAVTANRYISTPSIDAYTSSPGNPDIYGVGDWGYGRTTPRGTYNLQATPNILNDNFFTLGNINFALHSFSSSVSISILTHDNQVLDNITETLIFTSSRVITSPNGGITLTIGSVSVDDGGVGTYSQLPIYQPTKYYMPGMSMTASIGDFFPNGGRFKIVASYSYHANPADVISNTFTPNVETIDRFIDRNPLTATFAGITQDEVTPTLAYYSGIAYYKDGSTFGITVSDIDNINAISQTTGNQLEVTQSGNMGGGALSTSGTGITGWVNNWDDINDTHYYTYVADFGNSTYESPAFNGATNLLVTNSGSYLSALIRDWVTYTNTSNVSYHLIDNNSAQTGAWNNDPVRGELKRIPVSQVLTNGSATFNSNNSLLTTYNDELQYIFGRIIYPQQDFSIFRPNTNIANNMDYSAASAPNKSFSIFTDLNDPASSPYGTATTLAFNGFRWYVTSYGGNATYTNPFTYGTFTFTGVYAESDLKWNALTNNANASEELVFLVGVNDTLASTYPNKFIYLSADPSSYPGRMSSGSVNLSNNRLKFTLDGFPAVNKIWLMIGFKNSARGKDLRITSITFAPNT